MVDEDARNQRTAISLVVLMVVVGILATIAFIWHGPLALPVNAPPASATAPAHP
jgi:hypothetical protein